MGVLSSFWAGKREIARRGVARHRIAHREVICWRIERTCIAPASTPAAAARRPPRRARKRHRRAGAMPRAWAARPSCQGEILSKQRVHRRQPSSSSARAPRRACGLARRKAAARARNSCRPAHRHQRSARALSENKYICQRRAASWHRVFFYQNRNNRAAMAAGQGRP